MNALPMPPAQVTAGQVVDFDIYAPHREDEDFFAAWVRLREDTPYPVVWTPRNGGHWIATRGAGVLEVFQDFARFSSDAFGVPRAQDAQRPLGALLKDPPQHQPYRQFLNAGLSPRIIRASEPAIRARAVALIEGLRPRGRCEVVRDFADVLPLSVFLELVNLPLGDREMLADWTAETVRGADVTAREQAFAALADYLRPVLAARRGRAGDDMLSAIANLCVDGKIIDDDEAIGAAIHLVMAGLDTVASLLVFVLDYLARHPDERRRLREEPARLQPAATEFIRRFPLVVMSRRVRADCVFEGTLLRNGDMISAASMLYNLDPDLFPDPLRFDPDRRTVQVATFGHGIHRCPGALLGRTELLVTLQEWLARIPDFELDGSDELPTRGGIVASMDRLPLRWRT
ncbi:MAG: cytochrome P450 [Gammaproteobacteria bacterium]